MKKTFFLLLLIIPFFVACSDDIPSYSVSDISGRWVCDLPTPKVINTNNPKANKAIYEDIQSGEYYNEMIFREDGSMFWANEDGTFSIRRNKLTINQGSYTTTIHVSISDGILSFNIDETDYYQSYVKNIVPNEKNIEVYRVETTYHYARK